MSQRFQDWIVLNYPHIWMEFSKQMKEEREEHYKKVDEKMRKINEGFRWEERE